MILIRIHTMYLIIIQSLLVDYALSYQVLQLSSRVSDMVEVYSDRDIPTSKESGLSISKGDTFYIKNILQEKGNMVYIANNQHGISGEILVKDLGNTALPSWFTTIDREETEEKLMEEEYSAGDFFIRPAERGNDGDFSVSVRFPKKVHHFKLCKTKNKDSWTVSNKSYTSLQEVVKNFQKNPLVRNEKKQTLTETANTEVVTVPEVTDYYDDLGDYDGYEYEEDGGYYNA